MGNAHAALLARQISDDAPRLYWPSPPYEGPMKLRFGCAQCNEEAIELDPYPQIWRDLVKLEGLCFKCGRRRRIRTKFLEFAKEREPLYVYSGDRMHMNELGEQLLHFLRTSQCTETSNPEEVNFKRFCQPGNIRNKLLEVSFLWPDNFRHASLNERRKFLMQTIKHKLRSDADQWLLVVPDRDHLIQYASKQFLAASTEKLHCELTVKFSGEPALDLGGVMREFFSETSKRLLDPSLGLFDPTGPNNTYHPSTSSSCQENHLEYFRFFGRLIGKAFFEGVVISANFTRALFKLMLGKPVTFADFQTVDKELYKHFKELLHYDEETLESLSLDFTAVTQEYGKPVVHELVEGGSMIQVTKSNLHEYIKAYSSWRMVDAVEPQIRSFLEGFYDVIPVQLLSCFTESELEILVCGMPQIDVTEWRANTIAINFPGENHPVVNWFWEIMNEFDSHQRALVFHFATGTGRLLSFEFLNPPFTLYCLTNHSKDSLPYGHTCFNRLDLPLYNSKDVMKQRILAAINYGAVGFAIE